MIGILNYGLGNINAFTNIYKILDIPCKIISSKNELSGVDRMILPGVGAFDYAMKRFNESGLRNKVEKMVLNSGIPIIGICVGMQMLANSSEEGKREGLGWIPADVRLFDTSNIPHKTKLPHMGWNTIKFKSDEYLFKNLNDNPRFYFLHSYYFKSKKDNLIISETIYGYKFTSSIRLNNIYGVQFHPEKSHQNGIQLLYNFSKI